MGGETWDSVRLDAVLEIASVGGGWWRRSCVEKKMVSCDNATTFDHDRS